LIHFLVINGVNMLSGFSWTPKLMSLPWTPIEPARFLLSFVLTFLIAIPLYLGVEKPFMTLSKTLLQRRRNASPATA
jgi:peptidoglycan/LPS O-acetylase OafA/YrhL